MKYCAFVVSVFVIYYISPAENSLGVGSCNKAYDEKHNDYQLHKLVGTWYENATHSRLLAGLHGECTTVEISHLSDDAHKIITKQVHKNKNREFVGEVNREKDNNGQYKYSATYAKKDNNILPADVAVSFKLVDTDYKCWAVVYYCYEAAVVHFADLSVLLKSRDASCLNDETEKEVEKVLHRSNVKLTDFHYTEHANCKA